MIPEYKWYFGDGAVSTEKDPFHTYKMPGEYTVTRVRTVDGLQEIDSVTVRVYDWYGPEDLHVAYTDRCYKSAVYPHQGVGMVERGGENWVWPEAWVGTQSGFTKNNQHISLVLDNASGQFYRIGQPEQWLDRLDTLSQYGQGGFEIASWFKLKEHISQMGEYEDLRHEESYVYMRPFNETNRSEEGYDSETGMRDAFYVGGRLFVGGNPTQVSSISRVPLKADWVFREKVQDPRIQLEVNFTASGWRCVGVADKVEELDKKRGPIYNTKSETVWQREFMIANLWMSRDSTNPVLNRADNATIAGTWDSLITGPDGVNSSGIFFNATSGLNLTLPIIERSTIVFWINDIVGNTTVFTFANGNTIALEVDGGDYDLVLTTALGSRSIPLLTVDQWTMIAIRFTVDGIRVIKDRRSLGLHTLNFGEYGGATTIMNTTIGSLFDVRILPSDVSELALNYYYDNIVNDNGNNFLPVMR